MNIVLQTSLHVYYDNKHAHDNSIHKLRINYVLIQSSLNHKKHGF